ncbi:histidine kinase [Roseococcus sp. SDR]|uniref:sensor histidine kinase n=1 Tax=Roseococcus sp. SDR TaxID=2835532 RepID=UPI001BD030F2|nr:histidine kinase [Roseococcus sp. SDR]MBS7789778.1 histidine kinase [Roseococcus sp. SDR]MBV1845092.1 histidine kinase [Roseococcus sp. SDR]
MPDETPRAPLPGTWVRRPGLWRVLAAGWGVFAVIDVMTRLRLYEDAAVALGVSLLLEPLIFLLAAGLFLAYERLGFEGRITWRALPWILGLSLAASGLVVAVGSLIRSRFELAMAGWGPNEAVAIVMVHYFLIFTIWSLICFWLKAEMARQAEAERALEAEAQALRTELQRLRLQLDPHFLFNALNGIAEEVPEHPAAALVMLRDLSTFLRQSLTGMDVTLATVADEAEALASYLRIQEARFGARLTARVAFDPAAGACAIPSFLLQPLVENAIKHGRRDPRLEVHVEIQARPGALEIRVANTGTLMPPAAGRAGIGLANIRRRLALHFPGRHAFVLGQEGPQVVARLTLEGAPCSAP